MEMYGDNNCICGYQGLSVMYKLLVEKGLFEKLLKSDVLKVFNREPERVFQMDSVPKYLCTLTYVNSLYGKQFRRCNLFFFGK